jgi:demethylmenaquinone methyltransferase/2-methoxy-6-polyprenyl-1,4-benzoquinol methylase
MKINNNEKRLLKFWGKVDEKHIKIIEEWVLGNNVLDMGAGYGTTTRHISKKPSINCIAIDYDKETVEKAKSIFPDINYIQANAEELPFSDKIFDTIILRDALHHFIGEANTEKIKNEIKRVTKDKSRVIFFDPNINFVLKTMRWIARHKDEECNYNDALAFMKSLGFNIIYNNFNTIFSLPLSGGYVGFNFVPNLRSLQNGLLETESYLEKKITSDFIKRHFFWRYVIVGEKQIN